MINTEKFYKSLIKSEFNFFTGVPDSLLQDFIAALDENVTPSKHVITANEGNAIALAAGYYLATGKIAVVYMQNSGLGNAVNPLVSLADPEVYSIPMIILIGWRGDLGTKDEPQHKKMGDITEDMLNVMGIRYKVLNDDFVKIIKEAKKISETEKKPYAILIQKNTFSQYISKKNNNNNYELSREETIKIVTDSLADDGIIVSTTGKISRELYEYRKSKKQDQGRDFLTVGSMGHASSIALGIALEKPEREVCCFDGDGALLMHMGALSIIGSLKPNNFKHIIFNNFAHESVGGQTTAAKYIDIPSIALASGYKRAYSAQTVGELKRHLQKIKKSSGPLLLEIKVNKSSRPDLMRPLEKPADNKEKFMRFLK